MGMDRTGLYRKLTSLVGKTPTGFIRSVRLKQAACLLDKGYTVAEVADMVGFSTSSYLSKCFQEEFGVSSFTICSTERKTLKNSRFQHVYSFLQRVCIFVTVEIRYLCKPIDKHLISKM